jgi:hypothetical protein
MENFNNPIFKAQYEKLGVSITNSLAESTKKTLPRKPRKRET